MNAMSGQPSPPSMAEFDLYADGYDGGMDNPLKRMLGNDPAAYLRVKIDWMLKDLRRRSVASVVADRPNLLDFGCGHGLFLKVLSDQGFVGELTGCDVSREMLTQAARTWENQDPPRFFLLQDDDPQPPTAPYDIVVLCAVLHHVAPDRRLATYQRVHGLVKPGGRVYVFEHNPLNPVTSWVVKRTPIDRNAILLRAREVNHGLVQAGFRSLGTSYQMFFPPRLRSLHWVETFLRWLPLGGQYAVWAEKS
jgi:SAM-dependent methyltransferase